jgi:hypothetical protein
MAEPARPSAHQPLPAGLTPNEAVRLQYRRTRAKELVEEAKVLQLKHRYAEASEKMAEAQGLLKDLPQE